MDGTRTALQSLIAKVLLTITQRERLLDNARCRRVMKADRTLAKRGEEREHSKHRDVHVGELAEMKAYADDIVFWANARKKFESYKKSLCVRKYLKEDRDSKRKTKARKNKYAAKVVAGLAHKGSAM